MVIRFSCRALEQIDQTYDQRAAGVIDASKHARWSAFAGIILLSVVCLLGNRINSLADSF